MSNVIKFTPKKAAKPSPEEVAALLAQEEGEYLDETIEHFIIQAISKFVDMDKEILLKEDVDNSKMIAFLRETLFATLQMYKGVYHPLQSLASELVEFTEDPESENIQVDKIGE